MLNTVAEAVARIFNNDEYRKHPGMAMGELMRAFLLTEPAQVAMKAQRVVARTERGAVRKADWAKVIDDPAPQPEQPEQPTEDASEEMYGDTEGDSGDMYGDTGENIHE
jgi:hypothetical protein